MAFPTFLELVNDVLVRLREPEVTTVNENTLSKLVGVFINDAKRQVEDAYNWNALTSTITIVTTPNTFNYGMGGTKGRFKVIDAFNSTNQNNLSPVSTQWLNQQYIGAMPLPTGATTHYNFNGMTTEGDTQVDLYPVPNEVNTLYFNMYIPQEKLVNNSDTLWTPEEPVVLLAYARSLVERGEDGGLNSSEAYGLYKASLADYIAIESGRYPEEECWGSN